MDAFSYLFISITILLLGFPCDSSPRSQPGLFDFPSVIPKFNLIDPNSGSNTEQKNVNLISLFPQNNNILPTARSQLDPQTKEELTQQKEKLEDILERLKELNKQKEDAKNKPTGNTGYDNTNSEYGNTGYNNNGYNNNGYNNNGYNNNGYNNGYNNNQNNNGFGEEYGSNGAKPYIPTATGVPVNDGFGEEYGSNGAKPYSPTPTGVSNNDGFGEEYGSNGAKPYIPTATGVPDNDGFGEEYGSSGVNPYNPILPSKPDIPKSDFWAKLAVKKFVFQARPVRPENEIAKDDLSETLYYVQS